MVTILFCFSLYYYNNPLRMTYLCLNDPISMIESINLVNVIDLAQCAAWSVLLSV